MHVEHSKMTCSFLPIRVYVCVCSALCLPALSKLYVLYNVRWTGPVHIVCIFSYFAWIVSVGCFVSNQTSCLKNDTRHRHSPNTKIRIYNMMLLWIAPNRHPATTPKSMCSMLPPSIRAHTSTYKWTDFWTCTSVIHSLEMWKKRLNEWTSERARISLLSTSKNQEAFVY